MNEDEFDLVNLAQRVDDLEKHNIETEEHLLRLIQIVQRFLTNPKVKAAIGGIWSSDPEIQALLEKTNEPAPSEPTAQMSNDSPTD